VSTLLARTAPISLSLVGGATVVAVFFAAILGIGAALRLGGFADRTVLFLTSVGVAVPSFWLALILISTFSIRYGWFPALGYTPFSEGVMDWLDHLVLPSIALAGVTMAELTRQLRGSLADVMAT
ncbi:MAG TPA: ABC transporter permease, partial [Ilumatobacteraceae bacterium]|nr:ABC transporter permease [Ilumatobacteraceae bacterium]